jgi:hypothetical protein
MEKQYKAIAENVVSQMRELDVDLKYDRAPQLKRDVMLLSFAVLPKDGNRYVEKVFE